MLTKKICFTGVGELSVGERSLTAIQKFCCFNIGGLLIGIDRAGSWRIHPSLVLPTSPYSAPA